MSRIVKSSWTMAEDAKLAELTQALGVKQWSLISQSLPGRTGKQVRTAPVGRWMDGWMDRRCPPTLRERLEIDALG